MKPIERVLVAGTGAIGAMVAWQIQNASSRAVSLLARGERAVRYRERSWRINGKPVDFPLATEPDGTFADLVIVACKNHHLDQVINDLQGHVGPDTLMLSLLNGITSEEILGRAFGKPDLPLAMIVGTDAGARDGEITFSRTGTIWFGDAEPADIPSRGVSRIGKFFSECGLSHTIPADMRNRLWFKFMMNTGINQVSALLELPYRAFKSITGIPEARNLMEAAMREVQTLAGLRGIHLGEEDFADIRNVLDSLSDTGKTSMLQDREARRKTEVELFAGQVVALGEESDIPVPVNRVLLQCLTALEKSWGLQDAGG